MPANTNVTINTPQILPGLLEILTDSPDTNTPRPPAPTLMTYRLLCNGLRPDYQAISTSPRHHHQCSHRGYMGDIIEIPGWFQTRKPQLEDLIHKLPEISYIIKFPNRRTHLPWSKFPLLALCNSVTAKPLLFIHPIGSVYSVAS